jgi:hypothetical protein
VAIGESRVSLCFHGLASHPMGDRLHYHVAALAPTVIRAIDTASSQDNSMLGFVLVDRVATPLLGRVSPDGSFNLRRPRGFATAPRVVVMRGRVVPADVGADVVGRFEFHPAVRVAIAAWLLVLLAFVVVLAPGIPTHHELLWVIAIVALTIGGLCIPFYWLRRYDRATLRSELEAALRQAGPVTTVAV